MRVRLKGINSITKRLADGTRRTYWYAWKGGPPLRGEPGTPEFIASYNKAVAQKITPPDGVLVTLLQAYQFPIVGTENWQQTVRQMRRADRSKGIFA